jgi:micrococcal nuclease
MTRRQTKQLTSLVTAAVTLLIGWYLNTHPDVYNRFNQPLPNGTYKVTSFSDGDTIRVDMNGKTETIRFIGVDTPETHDPRKVVQCFGLAAASYTKQLIGNVPVRLEADPLSSNRDRYDRLLRYVYLPDGRLVQAEIIKNGYGFAYTSFPFTKSAEFVSYQKEAREQNKGLWGSCSPTANDFGGFTSNPE